MARFDLMPPDPDGGAEELYYWLEGLVDTLEYLLTHLDEENLTSAYNQKHPGVTTGGKEEE